MRVHVHGTFLPKGKLLWRDFDQKTMEGKGLSLPASLLKIAATKSLFSLPKSNKNCPASIHVFDCNVQFLPSVKLESYKMGKQNSSIILRSNFVSRSKVFSGLAVVKEQFGT